jgi:signal transduction histidine kinase
MSDPMPLSELDDAERRRLPIAFVAPYVLLAILVVFTLLMRRSDGMALAVDIGLCALAALWMLWWFTLHPAWRVRPRVMAVFVAGLVVISFVLVVREPWFGFFTPAGYFFSFIVLRWPWRLAGVSAMAVVAGTAQGSGLSASTASGLALRAAVVLANLLPLCGFAWLDRRSDLEREQRKRTLAELSEANRRLEATLAENAGLHEQLMTQAREAGIQDERQRMAREIHDTLAQGLTGIVTQLQAAEQATADPARWRRHFQAATRLARESLSEARRSVHALRPEPLESAPLADALEDVAARWSALHGIPVEVTTTGTERPLRSDAEDALLRTAQEALANVAAHAGASRVGLTLSYLDGEVALDIRDDGRGIGGGRPGGFGLIAMRQRIENVSGSLSIESEPRCGTAISALVPNAAAVAA